MNDMQGIMREYVPLQIIGFGDVYADESLPEAYLTEYDFDWRPIVDAEESPPQLYHGEEPLLFGVDNEDDKADALKQVLKGVSLRLPKVSYCWGNESLMLSNELAEALAFSPILGVSKTSATLIDAAGETRIGFTALSFHKSLFYQRINTRLQSLPFTQRPIIKVTLKGRQNTYFIHRDVLKQWQLLGVEDVVFDIKEKHLSFHYLCNAEMYFGSGGSRSFASMDEFQRNENGSIWGDDLDYMEED